MELVEQRDLEIDEKNATIKSYLDKIVRSDSSLYLLYMFLFGLSGLHFSDYVA